MKVSWDDDIPNIWKHKIHVPTTNQLSWSFSQQNMLHPFINWVPNSSSFRRRVHDLPGSKQPDIASTKQVPSNHGPMGSGHLMTGVKASWLSKSYLTIIPSCPDMSRLNQTNAQSLWLNHVKSCQIPNLHQFTKVLMIVKMIYPMKPLSSCDWNINNFTMAPEFSTFGFRASPGFAMAGHRMAWKMDVPLTLAYFTLW